MSCTQENCKPKQVIVMRTDLNMRKGKMVAQGAHASVISMKNMITKTTGDFTENNKQTHLQLSVPMSGCADKWLSGSFTKICVGCRDEVELDLLAYDAKNLGLPVAVMIDDGITEFKDEKVKTCIAIGPACSKKIDTITRSLKLL